MIVNRIYYVFIDSKKDCIVESNIGASVTALGPNVVEEVNDASPSHTHAKAENSSTSTSADIPINITNSNVTHNSIHPNSLSVLPETVSSSVTSNVKSQEDELLQFVPLLKNILIRIEAVENQVLGAI